MRKKILSMAVLTAMMATPAYAAVFTLSGSVNGGATETRQYQTIEDIVESVKSENLNTIFPTYNESSSINITLDVRGLDATVTAAANSTTLVFSIPDLDETVTFTGDTRDESQDQLQDYLESNQEGLLKKMLQELAATTAIDPVAGNPNSLLANMGAADFSMGVDFATAGGGALEEVKGGGSSENSFGIGLRFGRYSAGGFDQDVYSMPLSYTFRFESDPRKQLLFDLPLSYADTDGSKTYGASLGIGYRHPISDDWSLTPSIRAGAVGSVDLGSAAIVYSGSLTSNYNLYWDDIKISIGNMGGYYKTTSVDAGDFSVDYDLTNGMFKNGVGFEGPVNFTIFGNPTSWQFSVAHTFFTGDDLYVDSYFDFAFSFGTRATQSTWDRMRMGVTYTAGNNDFSGFQVNFGYTF